MFVSIGQFLQVPNEVLQRLSGKEFKTVLRGLGQGRTLQELAGEVQDAHQFAFKNPQQVQHHLQSPLKRAYLQVVFHLKRFQSRYKAAKAEVAEIQAEMAARRASHNASKPNVKPLSSSKPAKYEPSAKELAERDAVKTDYQAAKIAQHRQEPVAKHADDLNNQERSLDSHHSPFDNTDDVFEYSIPHHFDDAYSSSSSSSSSVHH